MLTRPELTCRSRRTAFIKSIPAVDLASPLRIERNLASDVDIYHYFLRKDRYNLPGGTPIAESSPDVIGTPSGMKPVRFRLFFEERQATGKVTSIQIHTAIARSSDCKEDPMSKLFDAHKHTAMPVDDSSRDRPGDAREITIPLVGENRKAPAQVDQRSRARAASAQRRPEDPCTSDLADTLAEREFMLAMQEYQRSSGRKFPTWSETLEVLTSLGYKKKFQ